ncbi:MAG: site-specific DNA-methyltransferase, partial [Chloroflexi bacterium]
MPNFRGTRLKNDVEFVIWAKYSDKSRYTFHHHTMKQFNDEKQLGSMWVIPICAGPERLKATAGKKLHPTQKPEELLKRIILASSSPGDVVLDPFVGTGTTAAAAKWLHRHWIGIDNDETYVQAARARVDAVQPLDPHDPLVQAPGEIKLSRVPFSVLLERDYLHVGQILYLKHSPHRAEILPDGQIQADGITGSIHKVGARLRNVPSCNGWMHWYYYDEESGQYQAIDVLRQRVRLALEKEQ